MALIEAPLIEKLKELDIRERSHTTYKETLLINMKGAYGVPELLGIRYPPEHEEKAYVVHYGHDIRNQEEKIVEQGEKDQIMYKYLQLGFTPLGEFTVDDYRFAWKEFEGKYLCIKEINMCFLELYRKFPGEDTEIFAEKQRRAWKLFEELGIKKEQLLPLDYWGFLVTQLLQAAQKGNNTTPQA